MVLFSMQIPKKYILRRKYILYHKNNIPCILLSIFENPKKLDLKHNLNFYFFSNKFFEEYHV